MLQNTPENKHLPGEHPRYNRKHSVCGEFMTLLGCANSYLRPEWPKPSSPRSVASNASTRLNSA
ncbi:hypothetical protein EOQ21_18460 [Salmonella bongori serovar 48:i:-]|nr:hypothetical protein [Salmonella bongori serovar 48:i:-]